MIKPLFNYVVAELQKEEEKKSEGGLVLKHTSPTVNAKVLAVGESVKSINVNDTILVMRGSGIQINNEGKEAVMLRCNEVDSEILGVL